MNQDNKLKKPWYKKWWIIALLLMFFYGLGKVAMELPKGSTEAPQAATEAPQPATSLKSKEESQKELDELMNLAKTGKLITSFEFSDSAAVVYAGPAWYTQTVGFKKDFLAKAAMLKKEITGYRHFEVRDSYSNEKVGEVTSFSGSLEIYK